MNHMMPKPKNMAFHGDHTELKSIRLESSKGNDDPNLNYLRNKLTEKCKGIITAEEGEEKAFLIALGYSGSGPSLAGLNEKPGPNGREAYTLVIEAGACNMTSASEAGIFYGIQTLLQLIEWTDEKVKVPCVSIKDWPSFPYRGVMVDMSHNAVHTVDEVKRQIDWLCQFKINQYLLYSEVNIALEGYPLICPDGRYRAEDIKEIIAYGKTRCVDVIPNLDIYGHISYISKIEKYSDLAIYPYGPEFNPRNEKTKDFVSDWIQQIAQMFESPFIHIGFDETWNIEEAAHLEQTIPARLFSEQLKTVTDCCRAAGKTVLFWADIPVKYPEIMEGLGEGLIPVAWDYEAIPQTERFLNPLVERGLTHMIQTGVANWREISIDYTLTHANIVNFIHEGAKSRAVGAIHSVWNDTNTTFQRATWPTIALFGDAAWQDETVQTESFFKAYCSIAFPQAAEEMASVYAGLDKAENTLQQIWGQGTDRMAWADPFLSVHLKQAQTHASDLKQARLYAEEALENLFYARKKGIPPEDALCLEFYLRRLDYTAYRYLNAAEILRIWNSVGKRPDHHTFWINIGSQIISQLHAKPVDMMDEITSLKALHRACWTLEYMPYRLGTAQGRFDAEYELWRSIQWKTQQLGADYDCQTMDLPDLLSVIRGGTADDEQRRQRTGHDSP